MNGREIERERERERARKQFIPEGTYLLN